jgi:DNA gyrase subunit A
LKIKEKDKPVSRNSSDDFVTEGKSIPAGAELLQMYDTLFGTSKNVARVIPNIKDGLKPVQRKILYVLNKMGQRDKLKKVGTIMGEVLKIYSHGEVSAVGALIRMATFWGNIIPYITPHGNFGSPMGDEPAAARYIEARLSPFAIACFFTDTLCIDMVPTYDNSSYEPETLPSMFPTAIINGATGSGYGQSTNIPQYNLKDVIETTIKLIDNPEAKCVLIPDSQWQCDILSSKPFGKFKTSFEQIFETGYGSYVQRFRYHIDHDKNIVIITALPASTNLEEILRNIEVQQKNDRAFPELASMVDLSGKDHDDRVWVEFKLYEGKNPYRFISKLESVKGMRKTQKVNIDLVEGLEVNHFSVRSYLTTWIQYRHDYIRACLSVKLTDIESDIAINDIKLFIFSEDRMEKTVQIYRNSEDKDDIIDKLMAEYSKSTGMTSQQASVLADMSGKDYTKSALAKYKDLKLSLKTDHKEIATILNDPDGINNIIKEQLKSGLKFVRPRGATVVGSSESVKDDTCVLAIQPKTGMIVKLPENEQSQKLIDGLPANLCASMDTNNNAIIFDDKGRYIIINPGEIPMMSDMSSPVPLNRYIDKPLSNLVAMEALDDTCRSFMVITKQGKIKKINPSNYKVKTSNNTYIGLEGDDTVVSIIGIRSDNSHVIIYTENGLGQRFPSNIINITSASASGSYGIQIPDGDNVMGGFCIGDADLIVYITKKGGVRVNQSKFFNVRKNKSDFIHLIDVPKNDKLASVVACASSDTIHLVYDDLTVKDLIIRDIPIDTMNSPVRNMAWVAHHHILHGKKVKKFKK